jgi:hypothetical protein
MKRIIKENNFDNLNFNTIAMKMGVLKGHNRRNLPEFSAHDMKNSTDFDYHKRLRYQKSNFYIIFKKLIFIII